MFDLCHFDFLKRICADSGGFAARCITHDVITEPNSTIFALLSQFLFCDCRADLFLESIDLGKKCEQWMTESLGLPYRNSLRIKSGFFSVEEFPNRNCCLGINSAIFLYVMVVPVFLFCATTWYS